MVFFNTKEEVIDIELTPYGKHLLSQGKWKPVYYEFYDDDILYDSKHAGVIEKQDETKERIKTTPRKKVQYSFEGVETRYKRFLKSNKEQNTPVLEQRKNFFMSSLPLGTSSPIEDMNPSINIKVLNGQISSSIQEQIEMTNSRNPIKVKGLPSSLVQLNMQTQNHIISLRGKTNNEAEESNEESQVVIETLSLAEEEVEVKRQNSYILFDISEMNVDLRKDNFEVFLYEIKEDEKTGEVVEFPLVFQKEKENVIDNVYIESSELIDDNFEINQQYAEYYFDIMVDKEIPNDILCKHLSLEQTQKLNSIHGYNITCNQERKIEVDNSELLISSNDSNSLEEC